MKSLVKNERFEALGGEVVGYHALMSGRYKDGSPKSIITCASGQSIFL